jgi:hypothetical protein
MRSLIDSRRALRAHQNIGVRSEQHRWRVQRGIGNAPSTKRPLPTIENCVASGPLALPEKERSLIGHIDELEFDVGGVLEIERRHRRLVRRLQEGEQMGVRSVPEMVSAPRQKAASQPAMKSLTSSPMPKAVERAIS